MLQLFLIVSYSSSGPPPGWEGPPPGRGCEIFVGKVPRDCYEDELVPVSLVHIFIIHQQNQLAYFAIFFFASDYIMFIRNVLKYQLTDFKRPSYCIYVKKIKIS